MLFFKDLDKLLLGVKTILNCGNMQIQKILKKKTHPIDKASHQLHHFWLCATQNRAGRWCLSLHVSLCFKITDFQEELRLKLFPTSLKGNWVHRGAMGK